MVPAFNMPSFLNTLDVVKDADVKPSPLAIRQGNTGQEPSSIVKTYKNNYLEAQPSLLDH